MKTEKKPITDFMETDGTVRWDYLIGKTILKRNDGGTITREYKFLDFFIKSSSILYCKLESVIDDLLDLKKHGK